ncbi:MAG: hypothetical protein CM15mP85_29000 [Rhodobacterales bacterium]|nr:MAG: hypothetical protein CM15mP85_29000 [Rhodobacterales bacterium]
MANGDLAAVSAGNITYLGGWFDDEALMKVFNELCLKAEIKVLEMPEGLGPAKLQRKCSGLTTEQPVLKLLAALLILNQLLEIQLNCELLIYFGFWKKSPVHRDLK